MKRLLLLVAVLLPFLVEAQYIAIGTNNTDTTTERYVQFSPTNAVNNRRVIEKIRDSTYWSMRTLRAFIRAVDSTHASVNNPTNLIWVSGFGELRRANINSVILDTASTYASKAWVLSRAYGNVSTSGSYINPSWITSLDYSKLTGTPSIPAGQVNSDWNSTSGVTQILNKPVLSTVAVTGVYNDLTGKPTIPSSTSQISEGSNLYYTDARSRAAHSAGTGISYNASTGIITNSAPDQTVSLTPGAGISTSGTYPNFTITNTAPNQTVTLTSGRGISVTGTYPNFTISLVTPTISIVARSLNTNFTPNATKETIVTYTVTCTVTNPLLVGTSTAMAYLEYSVNGGTTWLLPSQNGNSSGVGVTVTLQLTNGQTGTLLGFIPANALVRIRTSTTGTASVVYVTGQEMNY
jgi:hypothetical protein